MQVCKQNNQLAIEKVLARVFILLVLASVVLSVLAFKVGLEVLHEEGREGYAVGENAMAAMTSSPLELILHAKNPQTYWSAFKLWTYPYPFHNTPPSAKLRETLASTVLIVWLGLVIGAIATELQARAADARSIAAKWFAGGACLGFGALVLLAASPAQTREFRPHLTLVMSGVCIFIGAYALLVLSSRFKILRTNTARAVGIAMVLMTAFGAQSGLLRGYVDNRADQLDFIRTELSAKSPDEFDRIVVVFAPPEYICVSEPCDRYSGQVTHRSWHARRPERYWYAMKTLGIRTESKEIDFVDDYSEHRERDLVIDWRKFFTARKRYARSLRLGFP